MRLWHKDLIKILPREQLVAQWRECSAIAGNIQLKGSPNHILVNKVMDYDFNHFITYSYLIRLKMTKRDYKTMDKVWQKIISLKPNYQILELKEIFSNWMNNEYLTICYYNLKEKYICGGINDIDWEKIENLYSYIM